VTGPRDGSAARDARSVERLEDARLLAGRATYVDDIQLRGMLQLDVLRSSAAHARVARIDASRARALPGVVGVFSARDLAGALPPMPPPIGLPGLRIPEHHALASDRVRFAGEAVAVVVARDRYLARDAREAIEVEYEPLPAVAELASALDPKAPLVHPALGTNVAYELSLGGDVRAAVATAEVCIRQRMESQRLIPNAMETRGVVARWRHADATLTLWTSTQAPHLIRSELARLLALPEHRLRVIAPDVGGAFGAKATLYPEEILAVVLARRLGQPVKWIEERQEHMLATNHARAQLADVSVGATREGVVQALHLRILADMGAYLHTMAPVGPLQTAAMMSGCYHIPRLGADVVGAFTNRTPIDPYRGFGRAEAAYYVERAMDLVARELGVDPIEVRRRNFIEPHEFPYAAPTGHVYESGDYASCLDRLLEKLDYPKCRAEQARERAEGRYRGIGFSTHAWRAGFPTQPRLPGASTFLKGGWERATVRVDPSGTVSVLAGISSHGQGLETSLAQIAAGELGLTAQDVRVVHGDTLVAPYGNGTMGSRSLAVAGSAVALAAARVRASAARLAAELLGADVEQIRLAGGRCVVDGAPERSLAFAEVAERAHSLPRLPEGMEPGLEASAAFEPPNFNSPFGAHACVVEVDAATGAVRILRYLAVEECGRVVHPQIVEGQIVGGLAQGIGQALWESAVYDDAGQPLATSFLAYATATAPAMPPIEVELREMPSTVNPLGARGVGEAGAIGAPPAVVNAVVDALAPFGVRHVDMPLWPERVWRALREARGRS